MLDLCPSRGPLSFGMTLASLTLIAWTLATAWAPDSAWGQDAASDSVVVSTPADSSILLTPIEPGDSTPRYLAPTIEVRARRRSRQELLDRNAGFASVIESSSWAGGLESASSVLSDAVGVTVKESGGIGSYSTLSIRGSSAQQVPIYLDGVPLASPESGMSNLADVPLASLERIEVYRGAAPLVLGGSSLGGAVHLVSAQGAEPLWTKAAVGSYRTLGLEAGGATQWGDWTMLARGRFLTSDGDWAYDFDNRTPYNPRDDFRTTRANNDVTGGGALVSLRKRGERWEWRFTEMLDARENGLPGRDLQALSARAETFTHQFRAAVHSTASRRGIVRLAELYHRYDQQGFDDREGELGLVREERQDGTHSLGANLVGGFAEGHGDAWRTELRWARLQSERNFPENEKGDPQTRITGAAALQPEFRFFTERLAVSPGVRWEAHFDRYHGVPAFGNYPLPQGPTQYAETWARSYQLNLRFALTGSVLFKANLGEYQRVPTLIERFGNRGTVIGNPDLVPESGTNRDLGFVLYHSESRSRFELSVFHNDSSQLIAFVRNSQRTATAQNIGAAEVRGLELDLATKPIGSLGLGLRGTWMHTEDQSDNAVFRGQPLPGRPGYELLGRIDAGHRRLRVGYELTAMGNNTLDRHGLQTVPERLMHEVWAEFGLGGVVLDARVQNLTNNEQLYDLYGWPLPGRRFLLSLRAGGRFGR